MRPTVPTQALSAFGLALLLAALPLFATGLLVCVADEGDADCCRSAPAPSPPRGDRLLEGLECGCCLALQAVTAGSAAAPNLALDPAFASGPFADLDAPARVRAADERNRGPCARRLDALRTIVLLI